MKKRCLKITSLLIVFILLFSQLGAFAKDVDTRLSEIETVMDAIAEDLNDNSGEWYILDMSAYDLYSGKGRSSESAVSAYLDLAIASIAETDATVSTLAKATSVLKSIGYDARELVGADEIPVNVALKLKKTAIASYYEAPWALIAELQGNVGYTEEQLSAIIALLENSAAQSGIYEYSYEWDGVTYSGDDIDTTATVLSSLAPYYLSETDEYGVDTFVDRAVSVLSEKQLPSGSFGNANSDAMMIVALACLGINPDTDVRFIKGENSLLDGLMSYLSPSGDAFGYMDTAANELATEQGFRALIAAAGIIKTESAYNVYDFSSVPLKEDGDSGNGGTVTPDIPDVPPSSDGDDAITVYFTLLGRNGATWISRRAVRIGSDAKVADVIQKVLDAAGYEYRGLSGGYITKITRPRGSSLSEFEYGENSGWLYRVDDEVPNTSILRCGIYEDADIVLYYTSNWTEDPHAGFGALTATEEEEKDPDSEETKNQDISAAATAAYIKKIVENPAPSQVGGEWSVLGLARGGYSERDWERKYYDAIAKTLLQNGGVLHERKYTEYARAAVALTSIGVDARQVEGYNLIAKLDEYEKVISQGINGAIFALIASNCGRYELENRERYVDFILKKQLADGGFALSGDKAESDITAMAITALSNDLSKENIKTSIDKAVKCLSAIQSESGVFSSWSSDTVESTAQAIVALTTLGISIDDERFTKNGNTAYDALMTFAKSDGSFSHTVGGEPDMLATEQAPYALVALERAQNGETSLYDMSDVKLGSFEDTYFDDNREAIDTLCEAGIVNGVGKGRFAPEKGITRAEFAAIVVRSFKIKEEKNSVFADVSTDDWFAGYVGAAYKNGIINGVSPTSFLPLRGITRAEAATMVARAAKLAGLDTKQADKKKILSVFSDALQIPSWAESAVAFCAENDILKISYGKLSSDEPITRSEMAGMIWKMLTLAKKI